MSHTPSPITLVRLKTPFIAVRFGDDNDTKRRVVIRNTRLGVKFVQALTINNPDPTPPATDTPTVLCRLELADSVNINRALALLPDGRVIHADKDTPAHCGQVVGFSHQSGVTGEVIDVVKFGVLTGASLGAIGTDFVLGNNGQLITVQPASGFMLHVGVQLSGNDFLVKIDEPIQI